MLKAADMHSAIFFSKLKLLVYQNQFFRYLHFRYLVDEGIASIGRYIPLAYRTVELHPDLRGGGAWCFAFGGVGKNVRVLCH